MKTYKDSVSPSKIFEDGAFEVEVNNNAGTFQILLETDEAFTSGYLTIEAKLINGRYERIVTNFGNSSRINMIDPEVVIVDWFNIVSFRFTPFEMDVSLPYVIRILNLEYGT